MSPTISVLIRKNSPEVIRVITNHYTKCPKCPYCQYNNEEADEIICIPLLLRIVVATFSTRSFKTSIVLNGVQYIKSFMYPHKKKSHGNSLGSRSTPARFTIYYTISMYSQFENKRTIFTKC
jgi:hypothetical protein